MTGDTAPPRRLHPTAKRLRRFLADVREAVATEPARSDSSPDRFGHHFDPDDGDIVWTGRRDAVDVAFAVQALVLALEGEQ